MRSLTRSACLGFSLFVTLAVAACSSGGTPSTNTYPPLNLHYDADRYEFTTPAGMCPTVLTAEVVVGSAGAQLLEYAQRTAAADRRCK